MPSGASSLAFLGAPCRAGARGGSATPQGFRDGCEAVDWWVDPAMSPSPMWLIKLPWCAFSNLMALANTCMLTTPGRRLSLDRAAQRDTDLVGRHRSDMSLMTGGAPNGFLTPEGQDQQNAGPLAHPRRPSKALRPIVDWSLLLLATETALRLHCTASAQKPKDRDMCSSCLPGDL